MRPVGHSPSTIFPVLYALALMVPFLQPEDGAGVAVTVLDPSGALVVDAQVALVSPRDSTVDAGRTDREGRIRFSGIPPGSYVLAVSAPGFAERRMPVSLRRSDDTERVVVWK
ncbi:MAG: carboxypeptidase regulatory-like domain-containing protein [Acidobacteria bacterium]|nr:carboxypeptidase regulatory-like domain-containing protein [Acidobacteriota bacterium]